ncbi:MAG: UvrD-helicase domain-containing protein [Alphaproteobacteria bacterium]|nr:UvrD-helicase domain-containing protein [Alphaproteobacteria bacterium]
MTNENTFNYLASLNEPQRCAVETTQGPVLVLAGAGTGKTKVLTTRIAHILIQGKALPGQILSVTFTNKAAHEMKTRVLSMIGSGGEGVWSGTFHSLCVRMLRRHAELIDRQQNFTILDTDDQLRLIKQILKAENMDDKALPPRHILSVIGRWKDRAFLPEKVPSSERSGYYDEVSKEDPVLRVYRIYQERLRVLNAMDFGDLLLLTLELFKRSPEVLELYQKQFKYILVDEYQDTNVSQYLWLRLLAQKHRNICCVGDDDQSIYSWRGAEVSNILRFEKDFPGALVVRLEENYRSTAHILGAAGGLITQNKKRLGKTLWTQKEGGERLIIKHVYNGEEEARFAGDEIEACQRNGLSLSDIAILVRASFQTREFEDRFISLGIPYRVVGGPRFYERLEIRDAMAYLRMVQQPSDSLAFERIINTPRRGIGATSIQTLNQYARLEDIPLFEAACILIETDELRGKAKTGLQSLINDILRWQSLLKTMAPDELTRMILDESGYTLMWQQDKSPEAGGRLENLKELVDAIKEFESVGQFLEHVSLVMENTRNADFSSELVTLMTLHSAKGLEFDTVFLAGWEEGTFPHQKSIDEGNLEEERRLAYVGITRAKSKTFILCAMNRLIHGTWQNCIPSRFIDEIPAEHVSREDSTRVFKFNPHGTREPYLGFSSKKSSTAGPLKPKTYQKTSGAFEMGDRVFHVKFGYGQIIGLSGEKLEIHFEHSGIKNVVSSFVKNAKDV